MQIVLGHNQLWQSGNQLEQSHNQSGNQFGQNALSLSLSLSLSQTTVCTGNDLALMFKVCLIKYFMYTFVKATCTHIHVHVCKYNVYTYTCTRMLDPEKIRIQLGPSDYGSDTLTTELLDLWWQRSVGWIRPEFLSTNNDSALIT